MSYSFGFLANKKFYLSFKILIVYFIIVLIGQTTMHSYAIRKSNGFNFTVTDQADVVLLL